MAISRVHTWSAGEVLLASDLNAEYNNILSNASDLVSPFTKAISMGGFALNFDAANTIALTGVTNGVSLSGGAFNTPQGSDIASATTINLDTATGNTVDVTGTTTITTITLSQGRWRLVRFTGALTLTNGANLVLPGAANITTGAGDYALFVGYASSVVRCAQYIVAAASVTPATQNGLANGGLEVWQRGAGGSASIAVGASTNGYTADRWVLTTNANQTHTVSQQAGLVTASRWCARVQRDSGQTGTSAPTFEQPFELDEIVKRRGKTITVSFQASTGANWSPTNGTLTMIIACGTGAAAKRGTSSYTGESAILTLNQNIAAGTAAAQYSSTSTAVVPTSTTQMTLYFTWTPVGTAGVNDWFSLDDVMWATAGSVPVAFERRLFQQELAICERYYQKSFLYTTAPVQNAGATTAEERWQAINGGAVTTRKWVSFPVTMRGSPTVTLYNPAATNAQARDFTGAVDCASSTGTGYDRGFELASVGNASTSSGNVLGVHWTADKEL